MRKYFYMINIFSFALFMTANTVLAADADTQQSVESGQRAGGRVFRVHPSMSAFYERLAIDEKGSEALAGFAFGARAKFTAGEFSGVIPFLRTGVHWTSIGNIVNYRPLPGLVQEVSSDLSSFLMSFDAGTGLSITQEISLAVALGYSVDVSSDFSKTEKSNTVESESKIDVEKFQSVTLEAQSLYALSDEFSLGADLIYKAAGTLKKKDNGETKFSGFAVGMTGQYSF